MSAASATPRPTAQDRQAARPLFTAGSTCDSYYLIGSRGSGQLPAGADQYGGLGQEVYQFSQRFQGDVTALGKTYGYEANPYPAVSILPGGNNADGWQWNLLGTATGLPFGQYQKSVSSGVSWLVNEIKLVSGACPATKILLAGYSQGAQVTGDAEQQLVAAQQVALLGVFLLSDPRRNGGDQLSNFGSASPHGNGSVDEPGQPNPRPFFDAGNPSYVRSYCRAGDPVCEGPYYVSSSGVPSLNLTTAGYHTSYTTYQDGCGTYPQQAADYFAGLAGPPGSSSGPIATMSPVTYAQTGTATSFSAGESCDPAGEALTFQWQVDGSPVSASGVEMTTTFTTTGAHTVAVTVTNTQGQSATASQTVTVANEGAYTGVPGIPGSVVSTPAADGTTATLTWSPPASGPPADAYAVETTSGLPLYAGAPGAANSLTIPDIDLPLQVVVVAVNRVGTGQPSTPVTMYSAWPPHQPGSSSTCTALDSMFDNYGNQGAGWTGGDGTMSIALPDGRTAWFFSDTFLGTVTNGTRPAGTPMIHNSIVVQNGSTLSTITGGTASAPTSVVGGTTDSNPANGWYWNQDGVVNGSTLQVFYHNYKSGGGALNYVSLGSAIATFSLPSLALQSVTTLDTSPQINWGAAVVQGTDGYTYIYGEAGANGANYLHIARVPNGQLLSSGDSPTANWQYWSNNPNFGSSGWSSSESDSAGVLTGVGTGFSVKYLNGQYVLVTMDSATAFSPDVLAYFSASPQGPFTRQTLLYKAPEANGSTIVYDARLHPEQNCGSGFVVSYDVNTLTPGGNYADVTIYRPRFLEVTLPGPPNVAALPDAPTNLQATTGTGTSSSTVTLTWNAPVGLNDTGLTYRVYQRNESTGDTQYTPLSTTTTATTYTIDQANAGTYDYRVTAINTAGEGPPSQMAQAVVTVPPPSTAPTLTGHNTPDGDVSLTWTQVAASGWVAYTVYQEDQTAGDTAFTPSVTNEQSLSSATVTALKMGDTYEFEVAATNSGGTGPMSAPVTLTPAVAPATGLTATATSDGSVTLAWSAPDSGDWYWIYYNDDTANPSNQNNLGAYTQAIYPLTGGTSFTWSGLTGGHQYSFYLKAISPVGGNGTSGPSNVATATIALPPAPTNLAVTANNDSTMSLSWTGPSAGDWYWIFTEDATAGGGFTQAIYPDTTTSFSTAPLYVGHKYCFYVETIGTNGGVSVPSATQCATATLAKPTNLKASAGDGQVLLKWSQSLPGQWYWVYENGTQLVYPVTSGTTATIGGLTNGQSYSFYVTTIGPGGGQSAASNTVTVTPRATPPNAPTGLTATPNSDGSISLKWNQVASGDWYWVFSHDDTADPAGNNGFTRAADPDTTNSFTATFLTSGHAYSFYVETIGTNGAVSQPSDTVRATSRLAPPTNLTAVANKDGSVTLAWTASASADVSYYWIYTNGARSAYPVHNTTTFTETGLTTGRSYSFYITAAGDENNESAGTNTVTITPTLAPPTNLTGTADGYGNVTLKWTTPFKGAFYWVYEHDDTADPGNAVKPTRLGLPASDANAGGLLVGSLTSDDTYSFYVTTAYDGQESKPSNTVAPSRKVPVPASFTAKTVVDANLGNGQCEAFGGPTCHLQLSWKGVTGADHYDLYRKMLSNGDASYSYVGSSWTTSYQMSIVTGVGPDPRMNTAQLRAAYYVVAKRAFGGTSAPSNSATITIGDYPGGDHTDCYLMANPSAKSGSNVVSKATVTCPRSVMPFAANISAETWQAVSGSPGEWTPLTDTHTNGLCLGLSVCSSTAQMPFPGSACYGTWGKFTIPLGEPALGTPLVSNWTVSDCVNLS